MNIEQGMMNDEIKYLNTSSFIIPCSLLDIKIEVQIKK